MPSQQFEEYSQPVKKAPRQEKPTDLWENDDFPVKNKYEAYDDRPLPSQKQAIT
jgi:hypothetical protein